MNLEFIKSKHSVLEYTLKEGTKGSYYLNENSKIGILPQRISLRSYAGAKGSRFAKIEINGTYKKTEAGIYKDLNKGVIHSKIIEIDSYPIFLGWGEIDERFKVYDLLVLYSPDNCKTIQVNLFNGIAKPEYLNAVCKYLRSSLIGGRNESNHEKGDGNEF